jgi:RNA-binding protein
MLTGKQKRYLRGLGHNLKPVIAIGKGDLSEAVIKETDSALEAHELIKVKLLESCLSDKKDISRELAEACSAEIAQILGRTILLFRRAKEPKIELSP